MTSILTNSILSILFSKISYFFLFQFLIINYSFSQAVAFSGINTDTPDGFAVVALVDIPEGNNIFITDVSYNATNNTFEELNINGDPSTANGSVHITWTGIWEKGTIIRLVETSTNTFGLTTSVNGPSGLGATIVYPGDGFSLSGSDGMSVYISSSTTNPETNIGEIYGFAKLTDNSVDTDPNLDPNCPCSNDFVSIDFNNSTVDGFNFNPSLRGGNVSLSDYNNLNNYSTSGSNITLDLTEFDNITFGSTSSLTVLPIELTEFKARKTNDDKVDLVWKTASELNNDYFELEYSRDGINFENISSIKGNGTSTVISSYGFIHEFPSEGVNYYRLKQVDFDGSYTFSEVVAVRLRNLESNAQVLEVFPNPTNDVINISFDQKLELSNELIYQVYNQVGQLVRNESIKTSSNKLRIETQSLVSGIYILTINSSGTLYTSTFVKE